MYRSPVVRVEYPGASPESPLVIVERATPEQALLRATVDLAHIANKGQFGERVGDLNKIPPSEFEELMTASLDQLQHANAIGAGQWVIRNTAASRKKEELTGYAHIVPYEDKKALMLTDLVVRPPFGRGYGSRLIHAAITADNWPPDWGMLLVGYYPSSANSLYYNAGLVDIGLPFQEEGSPTGQYVWLGTPEGLTLEGVARNLERRRPELALARSIE